MMLAHPARASFNYSAIIDQIEPCPSKIAIESLLGDRMIIYLRWQRVILGARTSLKISSTRFECNRSFRGLHELQTCDSSSTCMQLLQTFRSRCFMPFDYVHSTENLSWYLTLCTYLPLRVHGCSDRNCCQWRCDASLENIGVLLRSLSLSLSLVASPWFRNTCKLRGRPHSGGERALESSSRAVGGVLGKRTRRLLGSLKLAVLLHLDVYRVGDGLHGSAFLVSVGLLFLQFSWRCVFVERVQTQLRDAGQSAKAVGNLVNRVESAHQG